MPARVAGRQSIAECDGANVETASGISSHNYRPIVGVYVDSVPSPGEDAVGQVVAITFWRSICADDDVGRGEEEA